MSISDANSPGETRELKRLAADVGDTLNCAKLVDNQIEASGNSTFPMPPSGAAVTETILVNQSAEVTVDKLSGSHGFDDLGDELELTNGEKHFDGSNELQTNPPVAEQIVGTATVEENNRSGSCHKVLQSEGLEELEPIEPAGSTSTIAPDATFVVPQKPLIRFNFTSLRKTTEST